MNVAVIVSVQRYSGFVTADLPVCFEKIKIFEICHTGKLHDLHKLFTFANSYPAYEPLFQSYFNNFGIRMKNQKMNWWVDVH
jgi:hypothetical protein